MKFDYFTPGTFHILHGLWHNIVFEKVIEAQRALKHTPCYIKLKPEGDQGLARPETYTVLY